MLPDLSASHLLIVAAVALIVVGPKDLPLLLRKLGQFVAKMRGMANEFRSSFDEMARQSELDELRREVQAMRSGVDPAVQAAMTAHHATNEALFGDVERELDAAYEPQLPFEPSEPSPPLPAPAAAAPQVKL